MVKLRNEALRLDHIAFAITWSGVQVLITHLDLPGRTLGIMCPRSRRSLSPAQPHCVWVKPSGSWPLGVNQVNNESLLANKRLMMTYNISPEYIAETNAGLHAPDQQLIHSCIQFQRRHIEYTEWARLNIVDAVGDQPPSTHADDLEVLWERALYCIENLASLTQLGAIYKLDAARVYAAWASPGDGRATAFLAQAYAELHAFSPNPGTSYRAVATPPTNSNGVAPR